MGKLKNTTFPIMPFFGKYTTVAVVPSIRGLSSIFTLGGINTTLYYNFEL
jgi:hypothetical protein